MATTGRSWRWPEMASDLEPSLSDLDTQIINLLAERTKQLLKLKELNKNIDTVLLAREHLESAGEACSE